MSRHQGKGFMMLFGAIVNSGAIVVGSILGIMFINISKKTKTVPIVVIKIILIGAKKVNP